MPSSPAPAGPPLPRKLHDRNRAGRLVSAPERWAVVSTSRASRMVAAMDVIATVDEHPVLVLTEPGLEVAWMQRLEAARPGHAQRFGEGFGDPLRWSSPWVPAVAPSPAGASRTSAGVAPWPGADGFLMTGLAVRFLGAAAHKKALLRRAASWHGDARRGLGASWVLRASARPLGSTSRCCWPRSLSPVGQLATVVPIRSPSPRLVRTVQSRLDRGDGARRRVVWGGVGLVGDGHGAGGGHGAVQALTGTAERSACGDAPRGDHAGDCAEVELNVSEVMPAGYGFMLPGAGSLELTGP